MVIVVLATSIYASNDAISDALVVRKKRPIHNPANPHVPDPVPTASTFPTQSPADRDHDEYRTCASARHTTGSTVRVSAIITQ